MKDGAVGFHKSSLRRLRLVEKDRTIVRLIPPAFSQFSRGPFLMLLALPTRDPQHSNRYPPRVGSKPYLIYADVRNP